jgi:peptidyl-tRNA hydrolase
MRLKFGGGLGGHNGLKDITPTSAPRITGACASASAIPATATKSSNYVLKPPRREERERNRRRARPRPAGLADAGARRFRRRHAAHQFETCIAQ